MDLLAKSVHSEKKVETVNTTANEDSFKGIFLNPEKQERSAKLIQKNYRRF